MKPIPELFTIFAYINEVIRIGIKILISAFYLIIAIGLILFRNAMIIFTDNLQSYFKSDGVCDGDFMCRSPL
jgi:hypothetical protein